MIKIFQKKNKLIGSWTTTPDQIIFEILINNPFDFHVIDLEHTSINEHQCENLIRLSNLKEKNVLIRLTSNNEDQIKKVLDAGANGLILPNIKSNEELNNIFKKIFYPPLGSRGVGLTRASDFGSKFTNYYKNINKKLNIISIIENKYSLQNLDLITKNKNLDGIMIGPYDLSASLGVPGNFETLIFKKAIKKIISLAKKNNKKVGIHLVEPDLLKLKKELIKFDFIIYSIDVLILKREIEKVFK